MGKEWARKGWTPGFAGFDSWTERGTFWGSLAPCVLAFGYTIPSRGFGCDPKGFVSRVSSGENPNCPKLAPTSSWPSNPESLPHHIAVTVLGRDSRRTPRRLPLGRHLRPAGAAHGWQLTRWSSRGPSAFPCSAPSGPTPKVERRVQWCVQWPETGGLWRASRSCGFVERLKYGLMPKNPGRLSIEPMKVDLKHSESFGCLNPIFSPEIH